MNIEKIENVVMELDQRGLRRLADALEAAFAETGEPVAWRWRGLTGADGTQRQPRLCVQREQGSCGR